MTSSWDTLIKQEPDLTLNAINIYRSILADLQAHNNVPQDDSKFDVTLNTQIFKDHTNINDRIRQDYVYVKGEYQSN